MFGNLLESKGLIKHCLTAHLQSVTVINKAIINGIEIHQNALLLYNFLNVVFGVLNGINQSICCAKL